MFLEFIVCGEIIFLQIYITLKKHLLIFLFSLNIMISEYIQICFIHINMCLKDHLFYSAYLLLLITVFWLPSLYTVILFGKTRPFITLLFLIFLKGYIYVFFQMAFWFTLSIFSPKKNKKKKKITWIFIWITLNPCVKNCYVYIIPLLSLKPGVWYSSTQTFYVSQ